MRACILVFVVALSISAGQNDTLRTKQHYVSLDVISACFGTLLGNYEYMRGNHGLAVEGSYTFPWLGSRAYEGTIAYRYHFQPTTSGMFIGPYFKKGKTEGKLPDENKIMYPYTMKYTSLGADWGTRDFLFNSKKWMYTLRLGLAYPWTTFSWEKTPPETISSLSLHTWTSLLKIGAYFDGELTLTYAF